MAMFTRARFFRWLLSPALLMLVAGCSQFNLSRRIPWMADSMDRQKPSRKVSVVWTETVQYKSNQPPMRGFGGRLMFFGDRQNKPMRVHGDLVVYAFDERNRDPSDSKPTRKYVFPAETLDKLYSKSDLGHSYSVWVPWDELGGPKEDISLIVRFSPEEGPPVISDQTKLTLPGKKRPTAGYADRTRRGHENADGQQVQAVSYNRTMPTGPPWQVGSAAYASRSPTQGFGPEEIPVPGDVASAPNSTGRMQTTTIDLSTNFGRRAPVARTRPRSTPSRSVRQSFSTTGTYDLKRKTTGSLPESPSRPPPTRYSLSRSQPLGAPIARLSRERGPWQRRPARWPSRSQPAPELPTGPLAP